MTSDHLPIRRRSIVSIPAVLVCITSTVWSAHGLADHWAFQRPGRPDLPHVVAHEWCRNPIDVFVLAKLESGGLAPSAPASRETIVRRLSLDLTGLPPTLAEIDAFLADESPDAYEAVVDRLLASAAFGERMTLPWMDAARYGDTSALNADGVREMWPWRDWVIDAYNSNKPFDEFLTEQLAGDLLPRPSVGQLIASGFNRNNGTSDENGAIPEELRVDYVTDRVQTTFNVFQGISMECAQCHEHKYDPISQEEYYGVFAFFNNTRDPGLQTRAGNQPPLVHLPDAQMIRRIEAIDHQIARLQDRFAKSAPTTEEVATWCERQQGADREMLAAGPWFMLGDFCGGELQHVFNPNQYLPENAPPDLANAAGEFTWKTVPDWIDDEENRVWMTRSSARYFYRRIDSPAGQTTTLTLSGANACRVWLNGVQIGSVMGLPIETPPDAPDRQSIEVRCVVLYD